ncbi:MAG TPA: rhodanese-like domain-containing protein [Phycisphaerae bacterium]|nr:rhodanese-like domain-containing protein [Phycisphaerae bacterium]
MRATQNSILECLVIAAVGVIAGLLANGLSARGLTLGKDYFPRLPAAGRPADTKPATTGRPASAPNADAEDALIESLTKEGFHYMRHDEVVALFNDPLYQAEACLIIDVRDEEDYAPGHIPGALLLDHYRIERYIDAVLPLCRQALKIVLYCNGGDCEDSKFAAVDLIHRGIDPSRIFVYPGGFTRWQQSGLPVERGHRNSGDIVTGGQTGGHP